MNVKINTSAIALVCLFQSVHIYLAIDHSIAVYQAINNSHFITIYLYRSIQPSCMHANTHIAISKDKLILTQGF